MVISKQELRRIAGICRLDFSDEEYESLRQSLENTIQEAQILFSTGDTEAFPSSIPTIDSENLMEIAKNSFSICRPEKEPQ